MTRQIGRETASQRRTKREFETVIQAATGCRDCFNRGEVSATDIDVAQPRPMGHRYWDLSFRVAILMINPGRSLVRHGYHSYPDSMLGRCFELHTDPLLQILRPTVVLASGNKTHSFSGNIAAKSPRTRVIRMMHYAHREGRAVERKHLKRVRSELDTLRLAHGHAG